MIKSMLNFVLVHILMIAPLMTNAVCNFMNLSAADSRVTVVSTQLLLLSVCSRQQCNSCEHTAVIARRVLRQGCAFWGLEYLIFTFLPISSPKIVKIKPEIGNFQPKC